MSTQYQMWLAVCLSIVVGLSASTLALHVIEHLKAPWNEFDIRNNDFFDNPMNRTELPIEFGHGNFIWPQGWTKEQAAEWRKQHRG